MKKEMNINEMFEEIDSYELDEGIAYIMGSYDSTYKSNKMNSEEMREYQDKIYNGTQGE